MLAFLMPLKIVMLLGSEGIPSYFPEAFHTFEKNAFIITLVILSLAAYVVSVISKGISEKATEHGVKNLLKKTQKIIIFENQDTFASKAYTKYTDALAGLIFSLITLGVLSIFYRDIAIFITAALFIAYITVYILYASSPKLETVINERSHPIAIGISNIVFLLIFLYIVIDFLYFTPPGFIVGLITIIIGRLMLGRLSFTASYLFSLKKDEGKVNALFFHHHTFLPVDTKRNKTVWDLLNYNSLQHWLNPVLEEATGVEHGKVTIEWQQTRINNIVVLQAHAADEEKTFLIKLFEKRLTSLALHESTLMVEANTDFFPCPPLLLTTTIESYHCHIFDITNLEFLGIKDAIPLSNEVNKNLLIIAPSNELIERYRRSKAPIWERIDTSMMDRLRLIASEPDKKHIQAFEGALPEIKSILQALPLSFINPKPNHAALLRTPENHVMNYHWPKWRIEPAGACIDLDNNGATNMESVIQYASNHRSELARFPVESYELSSLLYAFEKNFHQQQYQDVLEILQRSLVKLTELTLDKAEHKTPPSAQP